MFLNTGKTTLDFGLNNMVTRNGADLALALAAILANMTTLFL